MLIHAGSKSNAWASGVASASAGPFSSGFSAASAPAVALTPSHPSALQPDIGSEPPP